MWRPTRPESVRRYRRGMFLTRARDEHLWFASRRSCGLQGTEGGFLHRWRWPRGRCETRRQRPPRPGFEPPSTLCDGVPGSQATVGIRRDHAIPDAGRLCAAIRLLTQGARAAPRDENALALCSAAACVVPLRLCRMPLGPRIGLLAAPSLRRAHGSSQTPSLRVVVVSSQNGESRSPSHVPSARANVGGGLEHTLADLRRGLDPGSMGFVTPTNPSGGLQVLPNDVEHATRSVSPQGRCNDPT